MADPSGAAKLGRRLDRHHPIEPGRLSSCARCGSAVSVIGEEERHLPTDESRPQLERLLNYPWPTAAEKFVYEGIDRAAASSGGYPVSVDDVVEALWPGFAEAFKASGSHLEPYTPLVSGIVGADGRWGRLEIEDSSTGHHRVRRIVLDARAV